MNPIDPMTSDIAAQASVLAASNATLGQRIEELSLRLQDKAEQKEFVRTRATAIWALVLNIAHVLFFVVAVIFGLGYIHVQGATEALARCTNTQFEIQQSNTTLLRDASAKERTALRTLVDAIASPAATIDQRREAFLTYQAGLHAADVQRSTLQPVTRCPA